jgi:hypothetical protein
MVSQSFPTHLRPLCGSYMSSKHAAILSGSRAVNTKWGAKPKP